MRRRVLERALQRRVADQQLRVGLLAERDVLGLGQQHLRQHDRRRALRRDRDRPHLLERLLRDELDRVDRALRADAEPRQDPQPVGVPRPLDRRDRREVELAGDEPPVELGRDAGDLLDLVLEPVEDRRHVHVRDAAQADHDARCTTRWVRVSSSSRWSSPFRRRPRPPRVVERDLARLVERAGRGDADERAVERAAGERRADDLVLARGEDQRQRRRALAQVDAGDLAGLDRLARAVEDVVGDLERDPEREPERARAAAELGTPPRRASRSSARSARGTPRPSCRGRAPGGAASPRRGRGRATRRRAPTRPARRRSRRARRTRARRGSRRSPARPRARTPTTRTRGRGGTRRRRSGRRGRASPCGRARRRRRPRPTAARPAARRRRRAAGAAACRRRESASRETDATSPPCERTVSCSRSSSSSRYGRRPGVSRIVASALTRPCPMCSATIPPANVRYWTSSSPDSRISAASSSGPGKRRTLAGRYVYASPPFSPLPSSGTIRSNQTR